MQGRPRGSTTHNGALSPAGLGKASAVSCRRSEWRLRAAAGRAGPRGVPPSGAEVVAVKARVMLVVSEEMVMLVLLLLHRHQRTVPRHQHLSTKGWTGRKLPRNRAFTTHITTMTALATSRATGRPLQDW